MPVFIPCTEFLLGLLSVKLWNEERLVGTSHSPSFPSLLSVDNGALSCYSTLCPGSWGPLAIGGGMAFSLPA